MDTSKTIINLAHGGKDQVLSCAKPGYMEAQYLFKMSQDLLSICLELITCSVRSATSAHKLYSALEIVHVLASSSGLDGQQK